MHLLAAKPGGFTDDEGIIDLDQTPADIVILAAADSLLSGLAQNIESLADDYPSIRLANWLQLLKPAAFDLYRNQVLDHTKILVVSFLGGSSYWQYGFEQLQEWANADSQRQLVVVPGDDAPDAELFAASTLEANTTQQLWRLIREGGQAHYVQLFEFLNRLLNEPGYPSEDFVADLKPLAPHLIYLPNQLARLSFDKEAFDKEAFNKDTFNKDTFNNGSLDKNSLNQNAKGDDEELGRVDALRLWQSRWQSQTKVIAVDEPAPLVALIFYRSHLQSANTAMFDELISLMENQGMRPLPLAIDSLKSTETLVFIRSVLQETEAALILNTTAFSSSVVEQSAQADDSSNPSCFGLDIPVFQCIISSSSEADWQQTSQGLRSRDIAMQVVLPELDGRINGGVIGFKEAAWFSERCQTSVIRYALHQERAGALCELALNTQRLIKKEAVEKRVAFILANYPTKDGRIGNGVGLDTPASTLLLLQRLEAAGYPVTADFRSGNELITALQTMVTNDTQRIQTKPCHQSMALDRYQSFFEQLPPENQSSILARWGRPEQDPKFRNGRIMIAGLRLGQTFLGIQPARGFNLDLNANYHDPDLVPPHSYLAFYFWLRHEYQVDAIVHVGKHGNLEWLPGKGHALSQQCWPDAILGPMPHFYPFIVNDPGEGAQAKRRTHAVIIDHLMPPMARAEAYGDLADLEALVEEYYQAQALDDRRCDWLKDKILEKARATHVLGELGLKDSKDDQRTLVELDAYLCDIKEAQIRNGLHTLGQLPKPEKLAETLVALLRLPRGQSDQAQSLLVALVQDLKLGDGVEDFDPLNPKAKDWHGPKPTLLTTLSSQLWRTQWDTRERLERLALVLINRWVMKPHIKLTNDLIHRMPKTTGLLAYAKSILLPLLEKSADNEVSSLLKGLSGQFVEPGPSGAPTRGRLDTLPTGRNFYSLDNRAIPSQAAWALGQKSAENLIARHLQEHGDYPKQLGLSVWGTATMRTGGDDIAQAFALMGVKPIWATGSQRVIDVEIIPGALLGRPRVDVTLRVSGFFRDAFPNLMRLMNAAVMALVDYEEPGGTNCIREQVLNRVQYLVSQGRSPEQAKREAAYRVFGSKPGAYGAGLQGLIDERCWEQSSDLAEAYLNWGGYAYGGEVSDRAGVKALEAFKTQLSQLDTVIHNQDNREHDILDSDDYYQFQGGMTNAVAVLSGQQPGVYHNDHSNPASPKTRTLKEELDRVIRSRVLNPKWIKAMRDHGYKGAFEMAATLDYLFAYDATTDLIADYQYQAVTDTLVLDEENQAFMQGNNPQALEEMAERLLEAMQRGLWQSPGDYQEKIQKLLLELDSDQEGKLLGEQP